MTARRFTYVVILIALVAVGFIAAPTAPEAIAQGSTYVVPGNTSCAAQGFANGFKIDANPSSGTYYFIMGSQNGHQTLVTSGPADANIYVTITYIDGISFSWSSNIGIDAVIVKAQDSNIHVYNPEATSGTDATSDGKEISHVEFCWDYETLQVAKDAFGKYDRTITWTLDKSVDPASHTGFIGDSFNSDWTVDLTKNVTEGNYRVEGKIYITNPAVTPVTFNVSDLIDGAIVATVSCPSNVVGGLSSLECTYIAGEGAGVNGDETLNVATVNSETPGVLGNSAQAGISFSATVIGAESVLVDDDRNPAGFPTNINTSTTFQYNEIFDCSTNTGDYINGVWSAFYPNTATATGNGVNLSDSADVTVTCYAPVVAKDAAASYTERHDWNIIKTVDPESQSAFAGDPVNWKWTVEITESVTAKDFLVEGDIDVTNPAGSPGNMSVNLTDQLNDGTFATVDCGGGATSVVVAPGATATCAYTASPANASATLNTATGTFNGFNFVATEPVNFLANVENDSATFSDPYLNIGDTVVFDPSTTDYPEGDVCSSDQDDYGESGSYTVELENIAYLVDEEGTQYSDSATTTYTCYAPLLDKDADASYTERHDWNIVKTVDPESQSAFAGDPVNWKWTVEITETVTDKDFLVEGNIDVTNPAGSPGDMTVDLIDQLDDGTIATVDCGGGATSVVVAPGATETCAYTASPADASATLNTATGTFNSIDFVATADVSFDANVENDSATFSDPYLNIGDTVVFDPSTTDYPEGDVCSSDQDDYGESGSYTVTLTNDSYLVDEEGTQYSDSATTTYTCYAPLLDKDADASYTERHDWNIIKTVDPESQSAFAGDPVNWKWTVEITETVTDKDFLVEGDIDVTNPAGSPGDMTVDLTDQLDDGTIATVDCGGGATSVVVASGATETCAYTASPADASAILNTATGTFNSINFVATADVSFDVNVENDSATFNDPYLNIGDTVVFDPSTTDYPEGDACSSDQDDYGESGSYTVEFENIAYLVDEEGTQYSDSATTTYTCYAPLLDKDADASYTERHTWDIEKYVDPESQSGYPGDELSWTWKVTLSESFVDEDFLVEGNIDVTNPAGSPGDMTVDLTDQLDDGTFATVDCGGGATSVVVAPGATETCSYTASPADASAILNTATGTFNSIDFVATADVSFDVTVLNGTADVDDDQESDFPVTVNAGDGPWEWTETQSHTCSTSFADYGEDGTYSDTRYNTATVNGSNGQSDSSSAETTYRCEASTVVILKLTDGVVDDTYDHVFELYEGPDGFGGTQVGSTSSTLGDADGVLDFGGPALRPDTTYTICELGVAASWSTVWKIDTDGDGIADTIVIPYNPDSDQVPSQDLGNRCFDFGDSTSYPVEVGLTLVFEVDNLTPPGGAPRTPGYWKNWSSCSGGGQYAKTLDAVDPDNEFISLDEVLNNPGITWDDILADDFVFVILDCNDAVSILDQRDIETGRKRASDAAYTLAMHLLAAQLNAGAGACTTPEVQQAIMDAEQLLDELDFDGSGQYLRPSNAEYQHALELAGYLDDYNNGLFCGDTIE